MANNSSTREKVKELTDKLAEGVKAIFTSDTYKDYLRTMSRFHSYSTRNTVLIYMQKPDATHVAGFRTWQTKFGRNVKKGEKGIRILAPTPFTVKKEMQKIDPSTQRPVLDDAGLPEVEEVEIQIPRFKVATVFDASQTEGRPLPTLAADIFGNVENYDLLMAAIQSVSPLPIKVIPMTETTDGVCIYGQEINLREGMSEVQTICAAVHEITHAKLHDVDIQADDSESATEPKSKTTKEVEAESVAYAVCQYFGIETSPNSFGYLASWSSGMELKELNASLDTIRKTSASLIEDIEKQYRALAKERGIDLDDESIAEPVETVSDYNVTAAKLAFDSLAPGATVYLEEAKKPVEVLAVREADVLFSIKDMGITLTRTHAEVMQSLQGNVNNRPLLEAADAGEPLQDIAPLPSAEPEEEQPNQNDTLLAADDFLDEIGGVGNLFGEPTSPPPAAQEPATPQASAPATPADILPDTTITVAEREKYGYTAADMLPLNQGRALELFDQEQVIYLLHPDNMEQMAFERSEIESHDGIFGIEAAEWMQTPEYSRLAGEASAPAMESELLYGRGDSFGVYRVKDGDDLYYHRGAYTGELLRLCLDVDRANYDLIYTATLPEGKTLQDIADELKSNPPPEFAEQSLYASDVVVIKQGGKISSYYHDYDSFEDLSTFIGDEQEPSTNSQNGNTLSEKDGASVADYEAAKDRGESISLLGLSQAINRERAVGDAKKPSILAQLQAHQQTAPTAEDTAHKRATEREVTV